MLIVDALGLPLGDRLLGAVGHGDQERVGAPELRIADRERLACQRRDAAQADAEHGTEHETFESHVFLPQWIVRPPGRPRRD